MSDTRHYSDFLNRIASNIGVDEADLATTELTILLNFFNKALKQATQAMNWVDSCPYGEVRFPTNLIKYPNDFTQNWSGSNLTASATLVVTNPLDNRTNTSLVAESSFSTVVHTITSSSLTVTPNTSYAISGYACPAGRNWIIVAFADGVNTYTTAFNFIQPSPAVGATTTTGGTLQTATIQYVANGWYLWQVNVTTAAAATTNPANIAITFSTDGTTTSYAGNPAYGIYLWGTTMYQSQNLAPQANVIPWNQPGESPIDVVFPNGVQVSPPLASSLPRLVAYKTTPNGIQLINNSWGWSQAYYPQGPLSPSTSQVTSATPIYPVYLNYRIRPNNYYGAAYSALTNYAVGAQFYYTNTAGYGDYYAVNVATTAGQTPDTNPLSFTAYTIPFVFYDYCIASVYADWLRTEGQFAKAQMQDEMAQDILDRESDRQERQMGNIMPWKVQTHLTSRPMAAR